MQRQGAALEPEQEPDQRRVDDERSEGGGGEAAPVIENGRDNRGERDADDEGEGES
jgi:hypothetical protein